MPSPTQPIPPRPSLSVEDRERLEQIADTLGRHAENAEAAGPSMGGSGVQMQYADDAAFLRKLASAPPQTFSLRQDAEAALAEFDSHGDYEAAVECLRQILASAPPERPECGFCKGEPTRCDDCQLCGASASPSGGQIAFEQEQRANDLQARLEKVEAERDEEREAKAGETAAYNRANERAARAEAALEEERERLRGHRFCAFTARELHAVVSGLHARPWLDNWKPSENEIRNLVKAGALIAAEIDRLRRRSADCQPEKGGEG